MTLLLSTSDLSSLLSPAINAVLAEDEFKEPKGVIAFFSSLDNLSSVSKAVMISVFHFQITFLAEPC